MLNGFSFGSYYPGDSFVHKMDPRAKLTFGFIFIITTLCAGHFVALGGIAAFVVLFYIASRIPFKQCLQSVAPLMAIVLVASLLNLFMVDEGETLFQLGIIKITQGGVYQCLFIAARVTLIMLTTSLITLTTTTLNLSEALEAMLIPFSRFGLPAHELGMIMGIALRFLPQFMEEFACTYHAQMSRGAGLSSSPVKGLRMITSMIIPLFTSAFRHAETLSFAMDARCYHGHVGRTRLHPLAFGWRDATSIGVVAILIAVVVCLNTFVTAPVF